MRGAGLEERRRQQRSLGEHRDGAGSGHPWLALAYATPIGLLGGVIGLGGAEFRLPVLVGPLRYSAHRAIPLNLAVSLVTLGAALPVRATTLALDTLTDARPIVAALIAGGLIGAFVGPGVAGRLSAARLERVLLFLLVAIGCALIVEGLLPQEPVGLVPNSPGWRALAGVAFVLAIGLVSSLLGVAGGELIIPTLVFGFGLDIKAAGTASLIIGLPTIVMGLARYARRGAFADGRTIRVTVVPMSLGSVVGAATGGVLVGIIPAAALKIVLGAILMLSAFRVFRGERSMNIRLMNIVIGVALVGLLAGIALVGPLALSSTARLGTQASREPLSVAAAADLRLALGEIARAYEARTGAKVLLTFGSTGQLTQQIENGAPFDVFLAANEGFIRRLQQGGHTLPGSERLYARGRLALVTGRQLGRPLPGLAELRDPTVRHVAIANPEHAPYGIAAREALEASGLWEELRPKVVYGENIQQTMQYVQGGQAEAGLVALALAKPADLPWVLVGQELHQPLDQALAILRRTRQEAAARAFVDLVLSSEGQAILQQYGFEPPGGER